MTATAFFHQLGSAYPWLRSAADVLRMLVFLGFAALGLRIVWQQRRRRDATRATSQFLIYAVVVSCTAGFTQFEMWPFSNWALVHHISQPTMIDWVLEGVDANGKTYPLDPRFMQPLPYEDFDTWMKAGFMRIGRTEEEARMCYLIPRPPTEGQLRVARFLVGRAEAARVRFLHGQPAGTNGRFLGPLAAPYHFDRPATWRTASDVPPTPFVGLRITQIEWNVEERFRDESRIKRHLLFDYRS